LDALTKAKFIAITIVVFELAYRPAQPEGSAQDLHTQAASAVLARDFNDPDLSYLLLDEDGQVIAQRWDDLERDIPVGSLTKPFLAVAYGRTHQTFPAFRCTGKKTCWLPRGHGTLHIREAIALSCNSYFHQLVAGAGRGFGPAMESFELHASHGSGEAQSLATASPLALARAYLELSHHKEEREVRPVLQGLALSAQKGTAKVVAAEMPGLSALAKTGTALCTHAKKAPGDGFAVVMAPAEHPRAVLLVRVHGKPGFIAAGLAGRMLAEVESSGAPSK